MACPVCKSYKLEYKRPYVGDSQIFNNLNLYQCGNCELVFANPMPNVKEIANYNQSYFSSAHGATDSDVYANFFFESMAQVRLKYIFDEFEVNIKNKLSILEVGPGKGFLAKEILKVNGNICYDVVETDLSSYGSLQKIGVRIINNTELLSYDLIVMSHVLEHTSSPSDFLNHYISALNPGGYLFIEVPCSDWLHKTKDEPHLLFFEKKPIQTLLNQFDVEVLDIAYYGRSIDRIKNSWLYESLIPKILNLCCRFGFASLLSFFIRGLDFLSTDFHRVMVFMQRPHVRTIKPAWWIRVMIRSKA